MLLILLRKQNIMSKSANAHSEAPSVEDILAAADAIGHYLKDRPYAIVGGAACALLGSGRITKDVDLVVPRGETKDTGNILKNQTTHFDVGKKTLHTYYKSDPRVEIEILTPPSLFREPFDASTPVITVGNANVLKPTLLLNAKCNSILTKSTKEKKYTDATDIQFVSNGVTTMAAFQQQKRFHVPMQHSSAGLPQSMDPSIGKMWDITSKQVRELASYRSSLHPLTDILIDTSCELS